MKAQSLKVATLAILFLTSCASDSVDPPPSEGSSPSDTDVSGDTESDSATDSGRELSDAPDAGADWGVSDTDATDNSDAASDADVTVSPGVTVTAPVAGTYTLGQTLDVAWATTDAYEVTLSLVAGDACPEGDADLALPVVATFGADVTTYEWEVPTTLAPRDYRMRVRASAAATILGVGCSPAFLLQQPAACTPLGCAAQNRTCSTDSGSAVCGPCVDGYVESDGVCVAVDCGAAPAAPANATRTNVSSTRFSGIATYVCGEGYSVDGQPDGPNEITRRCGSAAIWEAENGSCSPVACAATPPPVEYATLQSVDRTTYGGQAIYSCERGYEVPDTGTSGFALTCSATGEWGTAPACEPLNCGALTSPTNGSVSTPDGTTVGATAIYSCNVGYTLSGDSTTRTCGVRGTWSGSPPVCRADCGPPPTIVNGTSSLASDAAGRSASYTCDGGYTLTGPATVMCGAGGTWGPPPSCEDIDECASGPSCTGENNVCTNNAGAWICSCTTGYRGTPVTGDNATCELDFDPGTLGGECTDDSECPGNSWCSTVTGYRRCAPRVFGGTSHQMDFVIVPAGTFEQGVWDGTSVEQPFTATITRSFFVSRTEVTQGQWKAATDGINGSCFQDSTATTCTTTNANDAAPVENLAWFATLAYANWLSTEHGLSACYELTPSTCVDSVNDWATGATECTGARFTGLTCTGYRLLTESEWERAARALTVTNLYWDLVERPRDSDYSWHAYNSSRRTHPVGVKIPNAFGLHDVSGNVAEWVWDSVFGFSWFPYPTGPVTDYVAPDYGAGRGHRGGSWNSDRRYMYSGARNGAFGDTPRNSVGFRLARTAH